MLKKMKYDVFPAEKKNNVRGYREKGEETTV